MNLHSSTRKIKYEYYINAKKKIQTCFGWENIDINQEAKIKTKQKDESVPDPRCKKHKWIL